MRSRSFALLAGMSLWLGILGAGAFAQTDTTPSPSDAIKTRLSALVDQVQEEAKDTLPWDALFPPRTSVESVEAEGNVVRINFSRSMTDRPWSTQSFADLKERITRELRDVLPAGAQMELQIAGEDFSYFLTTPEQIRSRQQQQTIPAPTLAAPLVQRVDNPAPIAQKGLYNRNIVVGGSHGWYYSDAVEEWIYQRCRLFTIVEDLYPMSYVNPFLLPMLENAGAVVFSMRERDFQTAEVVVDNDGDLGESDFITTGTWTQGEAMGWRGGLPASLTETTEPFTLGTTLQASVSEGEGEPALAAYVPFIPKTGRYAVYASWASSPMHSPAAPITVVHTGGSTTFHVNQQAAGGAWVFLGFFEFDQGKDPSKGMVRISTSGAADSEGAQAEGLPTVVSIDAIRFGGGMGDVAVAGKISGHPRYAEACKYWAQYSGAPAVVFQSDVGPYRFGRDYNRDVIARPEVTNYINGAPNGPNEDRNAPGLGVPIDLSMSFHTDAGISNDGLIGTLSIYRIEDQDDNTTFPDLRPRTLNRDLAALVQDEICRTVRNEYTSTWRRRQLRDGNYGEARRPNMPTVLLELMSHQNFNDMKYGNDPRFKRDVARAIYKAMLRFVAYSNDFEPVFTPLEPIHMAARHVGEGRVEVTWRPQLDPLEPTAAPAGYVVQMSENGRGFDNGRYVTEPRAVVEGIPEGETRYFRVRAANDGGISFPSRVVAVRWQSGKRPLLVVDGFDRICGPASLEAGMARGFERSVDPGVGYIQNYGLVGAQYDFNPESPFVTNDQPGWGASKRDWEDRLERGNTFDHVVPHAKALEKAGEAFDSATAEAYAAGEVTGDYLLIDWIAGRQRTTPPPPGLEGVGKPDRMETQFVVLVPEARERLRDHVAKGGRLVISGAYVIEDLTDGPAATEDSRRFAEEVLGVREYEKGASSINAVNAPENAGQFSTVDSFRFGRDLEQSVYSVESAESLTPQGTTQAPILVYSDSKKTAAVIGAHVAVFGFPLETVLPEERRVDLFTATFKMFEPAR